MFAYLSGKITHSTPTAVHLDVNGVGYDINISLNTYSEIEGKDEVKLYTHLYMREDIHTILLYGFHSMAEKELFLMLTSVSGIGMNTARIILSSLKPIEVKAAIASGDSATFKKVKGIGGKTADRLILDLKDKITRLATEDELKQITQVPNTAVANEEAVAALVSLGFQKAKAEKAVNTVSSPGAKLEDVVKMALKMLT